MENYIVINGKRAELTEEQLEKLGIKPKKHNYEELFKRQEKGERYFYIDTGSNIASYAEGHDYADDSNFRAGNYCKDESIMKQRALHETLNRLLWKASVIAGELDNPWEVNKKHYYIYKDPRENKDMYRVWSNDTDNAGLAYFPTEKSAIDAIENVIKPFMKEHPDFVW